MEEYVFALEVPVNDVPLMNRLDALHNLMDDSKGLAESKHSLGQLGLVLVKIAHVAVLHDDEMVATIWIKIWKPEKEFSSFTILGWDKLHMVLVSWEM